MVRSVGERLLPKPQGEQSMSTSIIDSFQSYVADTPVNVTIVNGEFFQVHTADEEERPIHVDAEGQARLMEQYRELLKGRALVSN